MNTQPVQFKKARRLATSLTALMSLVLFAFTVQISHADDIPDRDRRGISRPSLAGIYKVASSSDPFFPSGSNAEWFLDFGTGLSGNKTSGKVAVSLRQNPNVKVRVMVWQVFPQTGQLYLGNQFSEGSKGAVAVADWQISNRNADSVVLERGGYQIVLRRADPADY